MLLQIVIRINFLLVLFIDQRSGDFFFSGKGEKRMPSFSSRLPNKREEGSPDRRLAVYRSFLERQRGL